MIDSQADLQATVKDLKAFKAKLEGYNPEDAEGFAALAEAASDFSYLSFRQIGELLDTSAPTVRRWANGTSTPPQAVRSLFVDHFLKLINLNLSPEFRRAKIQKTASTLLSTIPHDCWPSRIVFSRSMSCEVALVWSSPNRYADIEFFLDDDENDPILFGKMNYNGSGRAVVGHVDHVTFLNVVSDLVAFVRMKDTPNDDQ